MDYNQIVEDLASEISIVPTKKKYWLIRTQSGSLYETFVENNFVGIDHHELSIKDLAELRAAQTDNSKFLDAIKKKVLKLHTDTFGDEEIPTRKIGLVASQIYKFYEEVKSGDVVVIPSVDSSHVSFGFIQESSIAEFKEEEEREIDIVSQILNKRVKWVNEFRRNALDPNIFRMFTAHHAISNVSKHADIIERTLQDVYVLNDEAHLIINVEQRMDIKAKDLFGMGYSLLELVDRIAGDLEIDGVNSDDLEVKINLNSPGKIDLKSKAKKTTIIAGCILLVCGGGYQGSTGTSFKTEGIKSLIDAISSFRDREQNRDLQLQIFNKYKDSLHVKNPEDMIKLLKQVDDNQDLAK